MTPARTTCRSVASGAARAGPNSLTAASPMADPPAMIVLRLLYTAVVMVVVIWSLRSGDPVGGLLVVPAAAVWLRREAESGRLAARARRALRH
jgi:hypothetical protein